VTPPLLSTVGGNAREVDEGMDEPDMSCPSCIVRGMGGMRLLPLLEAASLAVRCQCPAIHPFERDM